ncbi:MAG TPA: VOC family protein [Candidatus Methylomirabilis sp.]|nr:VOC family protein [Candidatus Methylomirabilis sp.]
MENAPRGKSPFSAVVQIGVIVRDMDAAVAYYESLGIGPFAAPAGTAPILDRQVHGKPAPDVKNRISTAQMGAVELELVQPVSGNSVQREFLDRHGEGVNHLAFLVEDLDREVARLGEKGLRVISSGRLANGLVYAYLDTDRIGGIVFELIQPPRQSPGQAQA